MRRWVWISACLAPVFLIGGWTWGQSRQPSGYDPVRDTISALAAHGATDAWIMTIGLAGLGASYLVTVAGLQGYPWPARSILAVGGAATLVVSAARQPAAAHVPAATLGFVTLALWPACLGKRWVRGRWVSLALVVGLAWFGVALVTGSLVGLSERVLAATEALAPSLLAASEGRRSREKPQP